MFEQLEVVNGGATPRQNMSEALSGLESALSRYDEMVEETERLVRREALLDGLCDEKDERINELEAEVARAEAYDRDLNELVAWAASAGGDYVDVVNNLSGDTADRLKRVLMGMSLSPSVNKEAPVRADVLPPKVIRRDIRPAKPAYIPPDIHGVVLFGVQGVGDF